MQRPFSHSSGLTQATREMQIKTTMRYDFTLASLYISETENYMYWWRGGRTGALWQGKRYTLCGKQFDGSSKGSTLNYHKSESIGRSGLFFAVPWTEAHQARLSMDFSRQEYWSGLPFPSPGESSQPRDWTHCRQILYCLNHRGSPYSQAIPHLGIYQKHWNQELKQILTNIHCSIITTVKTWKRLTCQSTDK